MRLKKASAWNWIWSTKSWALDKKAIKEEELTEIETLKEENARIKKEMEKLQSELAEFKLLEAENLPSAENLHN